MPFFLMLAQGFLQGLGALNDFNERMKAGQANIEELQEQARFADAMRLDALRRGALEAGRVRSAGTQFAAQQKTAIASSGLELSGTPAALVTSTGMATELDALTAEVNAAREAWGLQKTADKFRRSARRTADTMRGLPASTALQMGGSMLGGLGSALGGK